MSLTSIKSFPNGISLFLDPNADFNELIEDIANRFEESRKFFRNAKVALAIEGRNVTEEEERQIVNIIGEHSDVTVICLVGKNEETNRKFVKAVKRVETQRDENNTRLYIGNIGDDEIVESEGSLVIYGNVELGGVAVATKDVIVFGYISGQVFAGAPKDESAVVICFGLSPRKVNIGDCKYLDKGRLSFGKKIKFIPQKLYVKDGKVVSEILDSDTITDLVNR